MTVAEPVCGGARLGGRVSEGRRSRVEGTVAVTWTTAPAIPAATRTTAASDQPTMARRLLARAEARSRQDRAEASRRVGEGMHRIRPGHVPIV